VIAPADLEGRSIDSARRELAARFAAHGIETPELDARILVGAALDLDLTALIAQGSRQITVNEGLILSSFASRRLRGEPVARILGSKEFWGLPLALSPATLVPRPDTETVVEAALDILRGEQRLPDRLRIADIGTGTGAFLLALLSELPNAIGTGTDLSVEALATARHNAQVLGLAERASFIACDYLGSAQGPFDLIVSNPPYIPSADIAELSIEVREHDPRLALDGGADGLDAYRAIIPAAFARLSAGGFLILEIGQGQHTAVAELMTEAGFTLQHPAKADLGGVIRAVTGQKPAIFKGI
jgi:release factor glutamine methyltransferase